MSEEQKKLLEKKLWNIADLLRGKMDADDYRNYILGFIFFKYLSEKLKAYANEILMADKILYQEILQMFCDKYEVFTSVKILYDEINALELERFFHTLKGLAATIGAMQLNRLSGELELEFIQQKPINDLAVQTCIDELIIVCEHIVEAQQEQLIN